MIAEGSATVVAPGGPPPPPPPSPSPPTATDSATEDSSGVAGLGYLAWLAIVVGGVAIVVGAAVKVVIVCKRRMHADAATATTHHDEWWQNVRDSVTKGKGKPPGGATDAEGSKLENVRVDTAPQKGLPIVRALRGI